MALAVTAENARALVVKDLRLLAPKMELRVRDFLNRCDVAKSPIVVYETVRTQQLARMYYQLGASKAPDGWRTWHFYGLAVDVIHPTGFWQPWSAPDEASKAWRASVEAQGKAAGLDWGGDWVTFQDRPHFQFDTLKPSPSDEAIRIYREEGIVQLWRAVGAL